MPNAGGLGYYRTNFDAAMVPRLAAAAESLSATERVALLSDEWALVRGRRHDVGSFLTLAAGLASDRTPAVIATLSNTLQNIGEELTTPATSASFAAWIAALFRPILKEVGWAGGRADEDRVLLRAAAIDVLGRTARDPDVLATSRDLVRQELSRPGSVDPTLLNIIVNVAAIQGSRSLYDEYVARSQAATDPEERYRYLYGLAAFSDPALVRQTMEYALGPEVRTQDTKILISRMLTNADTRALAWRLLQARWPDVQKKTGQFVGNTVIVGALQAFCDARTAAEMKQFFAAHPVPDAERTLQQSIERVTSCAQLAAAERPKLADWLKANPQPSSGGHGGQ
jgi:aminopeptidase N